MLHIVLSYLLRLHRVLLRLMTLVVVSQVLTKLLWGQTELGSQGPQPSLLTHHVVRLPVSLLHCCLLLGFVSLQPIHYLHILHHTTQYMYKPYHCMQGLRSMCSERLSDLVLSVSPSLLCSLAVLHLHQVPAIVEAELCIHIRQLLWSLHCLQPNRIYTWNSLHTYIQCGIPYI